MAERIVYTTAGPIATVGLLLFIASLPVMGVGVILSADNLLALSLMLFLAGFICGLLSDTIEQ